MGKYKIAILSRWNATCGVSMHAELIGREFMKLGNEIVVFAPTLESANKWWHHLPIKDDEDFVVRCYEEISPEGKGGKIQTEKILDNYDIFIIESYSSIPHSEIERILPKIKKSAKTVLVVHEGSRKQLKYSNLDMFDAIVVFDERYKREILYDHENVHIIPYPCHPIRRRNETKASDELVFFSFGRQPIREYSDYIAVLKDLRNKYDLIYRIVRSDNKSLGISESWIDHRFERVSLEKLYDYLYSSNVHLLPKGETSYVVVSSTLCQCLGSLCPVVAPATRHFEALPEKDGIKPAVLYNDRSDLKAKIERLIEDDDYRTSVIKMAEEYVNENSSEIVAKKFMKLFNEL